LVSTRDTNSRAGLKLKTERKMAVHQAAMKIGFHKEYQFTGRRGSTGDPTCKEYNQTAMKCSLQEKQVTSWRMSAVEHERLTDPLGGKMYNEAIHRRRGGIPEWAGRYTVRYEGARRRNSKGGSRKLKVGNEVIREK